MKDDTDNFSDLPIVTMYMAQIPYGDPWVPPIPTKVTDYIPYPCPAPSSTEQEIGALKERVGRLEKEMRELTKKFLARRRKT